MANDQLSRCGRTKRRAEERIKEHERRKEREKIVDFFLNLYNVQMRGASDSPRNFRETFHRPGMGSTYELRVQHFGKWISRPMGIDPIGEEGGAKSKCFKVIYDDVLVVKVPTRPIVDFEEYIEGIRNERRIANQLDPNIKCIAPAVSPILKKVPAFFNDMCWVPEEVEEKSIARLKHFPQFQEHLKIGQGFAFFMDISRYSFLLQVLESILESNDKIQEEIIKQPELLSKFHRFEERYGIENASVWLNMNRIYQEYRERIDSLMSKFGLVEVVHEFKIREWFLIHLAEKEISSGNPKIFKDFFPELNKILADLSTLYASDFLNYRKTVEASVQKESFGKSKIKISGLMTSILRLLAELREKKVAIRDLKPENIFVTGDSSKIATALAHRQDVFLGLIDFETAISTDCSKFKKIEQPLLGGTPSYATPSNFIPNALIDELFGDVARVLHLQDWQACLCMIYSSVTGETLFKRSRNALFYLIDEMKKESAAGKPLPVAFKRNSYLFWNSASEEFKKRTGANKRLLNDIEVPLPYKAKKMFVEEATRSKGFLESAIKGTVEKQTHFRNPKSTESLLNSTPEAIRSFRLKWQSIAKSPQAPPEIRQTIVAFLKELEILKESARTHDRLIEKLEEHSASINAYDLLHFMFGVVTQTLFKKQWRPSAVQNLAVRALKREQTSILKNR